MSSKPYVGTFRISEDNDKRFTQLEMTGKIPYGMRMKLYNDAHMLGAELMPKAKIARRFNRAMAQILATYGDVVVKEAA